MAGAIGRLERMMVGIWQVAVELLKDNFLKKLGNERKVRDRAIVFQVIWSRLFFFRTGWTIAVLKAVGKEPVRSDALTMSVMAGSRYGRHFEARCRNGVKFTGSERHWFQSMHRPLTERLDFVCPRTQGSDRTCSALSSGSTPWPTYFHKLYSTLGVTIRNYLDWLFNSAFRDCVLEGLVYWGGSPKRFTVTQTTTTQWHTTRANEHTQRHVR